MKKEWTEGLRGAPGALATPAQGSVPGAGSSHARHRVGERGSQATEWSLSSSLASPASSPGPSKCHLLGRVLSGLGNSVQHGHLLQTETQGLRERH